MRDDYVRSNSQPCVICGDESNPGSVLVNISYAPTDTKPPDDWPLCPSHRYQYQNGEGMIHLIAIEPGREEDGSVSDDIFKGRRTGLVAALPIFLLMKLLPDEMAVAMGETPPPILLVHPNLIVELADIRQAVINAEDHTFDPNKLN